MQTDKRTKIILTMLFVVIPSFLILAWVCVGRPMSSWPGRGFPAESEIQYSQGILKTQDEQVYHRSRTTRPTIVLPGTYEHGSYYCGYASYHDPGLAVCLSGQELAPYINKPVTIGWYMQKDYLWFSNPYRQLVSLEVDGKTLISYQDTLDRIEIKKYNNSQLMIWSSAIIILAIGVPLLLVFYQARRERKKQSEVNNV